MWINIAAVHTAVLSAGRAAPALPFPCRFEGCLCSPFLLQRTPASSQAPSQQGPQENSPQPRGWEMDEGISIYFFFQEKQGVDAGLPPEGAASSAVGTWDTASKSSVQHQTSSPPSQEGHREWGRRVTKGSKELGVFLLYTGALFILEES